MDEPEKVSVTFRIKKIDLIEHSLSISKIPNNVQNKDNFYFTTTINLNINTNNSEITVGVLSKFGYDEFRDIELGFINSSTIFFVENLNELSNKHGNQIQITMPDFLMANFIGLAISVTRGMLATITKGTPLESAILPLQDPMLFAKNLATQSEDILKKKI